MWLNTFLFVFGTVVYGDFYDRSESRLGEAEVADGDWENLFDWDALLDADKNEALLGDIINEKNLASPGLKGLQDDLAESVVGQRFRNYVLRTYKLQPEESTAQKSQPVKPEEKKKPVKAEPGPKAEKSSESMPAFVLDFSSKSKKKIPQGKLHIIPAAPGKNPVNNFFNNALNRIQESQESGPNRNMMLDEGGNYLDKRDMVLNEDGEYTAKSTKMGRIMDLEPTGEYTKKSGRVMDLDSSGKYTEKSGRKMVLDEDGNYLVTKPNYT